LSVCITEDNDTVQSLPFLLSLCFSLRRTECQCRVYRNIL